MKLPFCPNLKGISVIQDTIPPSLSQMFPRRCQPYTVRVNNVGFTHIPTPPCLLDDVCFLFSFSRNCVPWHRGAALELGCCLLGWKRLVAAQKQKMQLLGNFSAHHRTPSKFLQLVNTHILRYSWFFAKQKGFFALLLQLLAMYTFPRCFVFF